MAALNDRISRSLLRQQDEMDCGPACLASIIRFHGGNESIHRIRELSGTSTDGASLLGLYQAANELGLEAEGFEAEGTENLRELTEPAILHVNLEDRLHYLIYYGVQNNKLIVGDPAIGIKYVSDDELRAIWVSKALLKIKPTEKFKLGYQSTTDKKKWVFQILREDITIICVAAVLGAIISILNFVTVIFTQKLVDDILVNRNSRALLLSITLVTFLLLIRSLLAYLRGLFIAKQGRSFNNRIVDTFYSKLLRLPKSFFDTRKTGELIARMNDTRRIQSTINYLANSTFIDTLILISGIVFVFSYSFILGSLVVCAIPAYLGISWRFNPTILAGQKDVMQGYATSESHFVDAIQGITEIKAFNRESVFQNFNQNIYGLFQNKIFKLSITSLQFSFLLEVVGVFFIMATFAVSSWLYFDGQIRLGEWVALVTIVGNTFPSIIRLSTVNIQLKEMKVVFDRMFDFTKLNPEYAPTERKQHNDANWSSLEVNNLSFRFRGQDELLRDVSFEIAKGQIIALFGESGSGKSTLLQILLKFYEYEAGDVRINHQPLTDLNTHELRKIIGYVPQEIKIFDGGLVYNICLSDAIEQKQTAAELLNTLGFSRYFDRLPQGLYTIVGQEGINLSGGQKQLIGLARALFHQPQLLLIDEATSAMDSETEKFVLTLLDNLRSSMGVVMVTHRLKTARAADKIYLLEHGAMTSSGSHDTLLMSDNLYSRSFREQQL